MTESRSGFRRSRRHCVRYRRAKTRDHQEDRIDIPGVQPELIQPVGIVFSKDGKLAFVALSHANRIAVVDTATLMPTSYILVGERPWHMALDPTARSFT